MRPVLLLQVLADLPARCLSSLLCQAPHLPGLLNALPVHHHPLALRARFPAVDTKATLALSTDMPLLCCRAARAAATGFPHLTRIAFTLTMPPTKTVRFDAETLRLLTTLPHLHALELRRRRVSIVNARGIEDDLGPCLAKFPALRSLSLRGALASLLPLAPRVPALGARLTALDLSANPLSQASFEALSNHIGCLTALRELSLAQTRLEEAAWNLVGPRLPPLASLDISDAYIDHMRCLATCDGGVNPARFWSCMEALDLGFGHLSAGLEEFGEMLECMPALRRLSLAHALPSVRGAAEGMLSDLAVLTQLTALDISAGRMELIASDAFAACMRALEPGLQELRILSSNGSVDAAAAAMHSLTSRPLPALLHLDLAYSDLRDEGVAALAAGFSAMRALTHLHLQQVQMSAEGAAAVAAHVRVLQQLEVLELHGNAVLGDGFVVLVEAAGDLPRLRVLGMNSVYDPDALSVVVASSDEGATEETEGLLEVPGPLKMKGQFTLQLLRVGFRKETRAAIEEAAAAAGVTVQM